MKLFIVALVFVAYLGECQGKSEGKGLEVTLLIYSGVPDPEWRITQKTSNYQAIKKLYSTAKTLRATFLPEQMPAQLGYKGFLIQENGQDQARLIVGPKTIELQQELLKSCPTGDKGVPESFKQQLAVVIKGGKVLPVKTQQRIGKRLAPNYDEAFWSSSVLRILENNCYNYANSKATNTFAQPGKGSGHPLNPFARVTGNAIRAAAQSDGLVMLGKGLDSAIPKIPPNDPFHLVALFVDPSWGKRGDFHWYRLDSNGLWSHKPGKTLVKNRDGAGNLINDPREAANTPGGPCYAFVCFMKTNKYTVNIQ